MADDGDRFTRDELAADARALIETVESVHPAPYVGYDNRADLHLALERTVQEFPMAASAETFYRRVAPLIAGIGDAHSKLDAPQAVDRGEDRRLPVGLRVVGDGLYVTSVASESLGNLLGGRLITVDGCPVESIVERAVELRGAENSFTARFFAARFLEGWDSLGRLLDSPEPPATPVVAVETPSSSVSTTLSPVASDADTALELESPLPSPSGTGPRYRLLADESVALFVPGDLQGYRESYEVRLAAGSNAKAERLAGAYERHVGGEAPDKQSALVAALPSMSETCVALCETMSAAGTDTLVVDLRDNPGGDSLFVHHLLYAIGGWDAVADAVESVRAVKRRTAIQRERYGNDGDVGTADENPAAYDLSEFVVDDRRDRFERTRERLLRSDTFRAVVDRTDDGGVFAPSDVVVVTSASTLSSAFAGAAQLSSTGATTVGVPPGQAPRSFGEPVTTALANTGLSASISTAMYDWLPNPSTDRLTPDRTLTPTLFEESGPVADAGLWLALDEAGAATFGSTLPD